MILDIHIHTKRCHHAEGDLEDYVKEAIKKRIKIIGFSEHAPLDFDQDKRLSEEEVKTYIKDIRELKLKYKGQIKILCGFEVDYVESKEREIKNFIKKTNADYYLGSIHFIPLNGKTYSVWDYKRMFHDKELQEEYFKLMIKAIRSKLFNSISHPDLILRSGINEEKLEKEFIKVFDELKINDVGYEINCSGLFKRKYNQRDEIMNEEGFLSKNYLLIASGMGTWFTIGSDAHKLSELAQGIEEMINYSSRNNLKVYYFEKNIKKEFKI